MSIQFNGSYSENFDTLASSGNSSVLPNGWALLETGTSANVNGQYTAGTGSNNAGDTYSFGATGSSERAFGSLLSGTITPTIGANFTNTTGSTITTLNLSYRGEQWRLGATGRADRLDFQYSLDATSLNTGTWVDVDSLDFSSPVTTGTAGALDGNTNSSQITASITGLNIPSGGTFWFRWVDFNASGSDDGLGIDDFSLSTGVTPPAVPTVAIAATDATAAEAAADPGTFRITRTGDTTNALTVNYTVGGGANQTDYTPNLTGSVVIPVGQSFVDITITPVDDSLLEGNETVTLTLVDTADYDLGATATATVTIADNDVAPGAIRIHDIQGTAHISPLNGQGVVNVAGIVTAIASNGFYIQDPNPDNNDATSEGIFIFTGTTSTLLSARTVGEAVLVSGTVSEFRPGGSSNNLTITQIGNNNSVQSLSVSAWTDAPTTTITPTILGNGGRTIPTQVINDDFATSGNVETSGDFDPVNEGIDFYESVEGMLIQINNPVATSPTANFSTSEEIWVLADNGVNATSRTERGGSLITATDSNPERIQIDDLINGTVTLPDVNVGAQLSTITGVVSYDFNNYEVLVSSAPTVVQPSTLQREVTNLTGTADQLTVATFNVENLDPGDGETQFNNLANRIVNNLRSPDIISLEEIQDNNGATNDSVVDASVTFQTLINAIAQAGGPTYEYRQINPVDDTNGGEPGGNIRVGFLFNPNRVSFVDRPGGGSTTNISVTNADGTPTLSTSPGLIDPTNPAFNSSRKPLVGEFVFNGQSVYLIGNHFNSKGGDQPLFGPNQPPVLSSESQRQQQATIVRNFVQEILAIDPNANVVVLGDLNDFEFSNPLTTLESAGLTSLIETLPANERYTYNFQGNAQVLDHILASQNLVNNLDGYDVVHINSEFFDQVSDHDPVIARFNLPPANQPPTAVIFNNTVTSINENTNTTNRIKVADIAITDDGRGTNNLSLTGADASLFEIDNSVLYLRANTNLDFETRSNYSVTVAVDDPTVGNTPDATTNFSLAVNNVNETPIANNDSATTTDIQPVIINVLANDSDPDSNPLTINSFTNPTTGTLVRNNDNTFTYTPEIGFTGTDSFTYTVSDGNLTTTATVNLTVTLGSNQINGTNGSNILLGTSRVDVIRGLGGNDIISGLGNNDVIYGGDGNDMTDGGAGNDSLYGENGNDILTGGDGNDTVNGGAGDDMLLGNGGNDILIGGLGRDILTGGNGRDGFYLNNGAGNADIITDFVSGVDSFVISQSEFGFNQALGILEPSLFRLGSSAATASDRFIYDRNTGKLFFDQDGIGSVAKVQIAQLSNRPTLSSTDFTVIA
ncbi:Ig-like domain-containing protein [Nostoc sp. FACHB-280]|uniref:Ig-like domain-containing protein n=1 Tax=Nostoc sp. FACHB-280 TaxID=2692839 RepID=UPI00168ACB78|nr:Ig-like domain-containing protein [Nostoc sp. FACHB-280]MBD2494445.1 cadherin-like domain-containing protein [Nostoc sp. FACHB-280]